MDNDQLDIVKSGESVVRVLLRRTSKGLAVNVQAHRAVEEFFRANAEGHTVDARTVGRFWSHPEDTAEARKPLIAYDRRTSTLDMQNYDGGSNNFERLGQPLSEPIISRASGLATKQANLSFLRLQGISEPDGVTFILRGVYSTEAVREMKDIIANGVKQFYASYLKPVEMSVMCLTQEVALPGITELR